MSVRILNFNKAFTLAEVLITLSIIGIIASMTIPSLVQDITDAQNKVAWKKAFSDLNQAYIDIKREKGGSIKEYFGADYRPSGLVSEFMNHFFKTKTNNLLGKIDTYELNYKTLDGQIIHSHNFLYGNSQQTNGMQIYFRTMGPNHGLIWVDVNGYVKGPNVLGKDLYGATFTKDWIRPMGSIGTGSVNTCTTTEKFCSGYGYHGTPCAGAGCSAEYILK